MKRLDLIINAIEELMYSNSTHIAAEKFCEALAAARSLRELKPVGVFEYDKENNVWEELMPNCEGVKLYALGDEK